MRRINLFTDTTRFGKYKQYAYLTKIIALVLVSLSFLTLITLIILLNVQQVKYNALNEEIPKELRSGAQSTDTLGKTAFAYSKLKTAEGIYFQSPEYYKQYKYLLEILSETGKFSIEEFSLSSKNVVELTVSSGQLSEAFALAKKFDSDEVKKHFVNLKIGSMAMRNDKDVQGTTTTQFSISFSFQFNPSFNETDI